MPLYDFRCQTGHRFERMVKLDYFKEIQYCSCSAPAVRVISAPRFSVDHTDYDCPITGRRITSLEAHRENLKAQGCRVFETGEKEAAARFRQNEEAAFDRAVDETVERQFESYSSDKKEQLTNELLRGADISVDRV